MYDQSFNSIAIGRELKKADFLLLKQLRDSVYRADMIQRAATRSQTGFAGYNFLTTATLKGKFVFYPGDFADELVLRKISRNVMVLSGIRHPSRDLLVANLRTLISEGLPYRIYRLDVRSFYESVTLELVQNALRELPLLSAPTRRHIDDILTHHRNCGHQGLPRGLGLSAILAELVMKKFDQYASQKENTYFYGRFVDDIIFLTNALEDRREFLRDIRFKLPKGLALNPTKEDVLTASKDVSPIPASSAVSKSLLSFDYLGYQFNVWEPIKDSKKNGDQFRDVWLDIADSKVNKIKTRIIRSLISFLENGDFDLLELRIKFLTSNFSVFDSSREHKRLAGIYHNYWQVDSNRSKALIELDKFLKQALISSKGKIFEGFYMRTSDKQRRKLLSYSFQRGFKKNIYLYFSRSKILKIQQCWNYA